MLSTDQLLASANFFHKMSRKKQQISYTKPEEPKFLTEIKKKVGYKEGPTIEDKVQTKILWIFSFFGFYTCSKKKYDDLTGDDDDEERQKEEEKPQVVILKEGDLTEKDLETFMKRKEDEEESV